MMTKRQIEEMKVYLESAENLRPVDPSYYDGFIAAMKLAMRISGAMKEVA